MPYGLINLDWSWELEGHSFVNGKTSIIRNNIQALAYLDCIHGRLYSEVDFSIDVDASVMIGIITSVAGHGCIIIETCVASDSSQLVAGHAT
ncbi:hypothetical protein V9L17_18595 [Pseudarthrobacter sp. CCNWLW207]